MISKVDIDFPSKADFQSTEIDLPPLNYDRFLAQQPKWPTFHQYDSDVKNLTASASLSSLCSALTLQMKYLTSVLDPHDRIFTSEPPPAFACQQCGKTFNKSTSVGGHMSKVHSKTVPEKTKRIKKEPKQPPVKVDQPVQQQTCMEVKKESRRIKGPRVQRAGGGKKRIG